MEGQNGNSLAHKATENGVKGKPPYSVETPYGFRLDLDFLKYVDDIEKGNTIKRVPIQRRSKGPRSSTLPRHLNLSGCGYRPSPWGSTGALGPRSRVSDHNHGYASWAYEHRSHGSPAGFRSLAEMEARIREFDEQPLGEHIRPNLLRASSLPLTVLLRQGSESTEDAGSLRSSRDCLGGRDTSCEDVFAERSSDYPLNQDFSGTLRRLSEALERVGELEMEVRVVPELKAQICILQEERERLRMGLSPRPVNGRTDPSSPSYYGTCDVKRPRHDSHVGQGGDRGSTDPTHEWRTSTDLDELLTVTSLQAKVAVLEQKLHENGMELQRALAMLREQRGESRRKDDKIEQLTKNPGGWVLAEKVLVDQDGEETEYTPYSSSNCHSEVALSGGSDSPADAWTVTTHRQKNPGSLAPPPIPDGPPATTGAVLEEVSAEAVDSAMAAHHIRRIKRLLEEQWECLCEGRVPMEHHDPKINSLQQEMMGLVDILSSCYAQSGQGSEEGTQHGAPRSIMKRDGCARQSKNLHFAGDNEGHETPAASKEPDGQDFVKPSIQDHPEEKAQVVWPEATAVTHVCEDPETISKERKGPQSQGQIESGQADGGTVSMDQAGAQENAARMDATSLEEQMESDSGVVASTGGRESVNGEFVSACHFLKDHMDNMDNPNDDMRRALVVLFQSWFGVAAEESSVSSRVAVHLKEVKNSAPSLLAFLVNLADDNGNTALHYSVSHCNYSIVSLLLDTGVSEVDLQNKAGYTAVMLASLTAPEGPGDMEVVRRLMELADVNIRSRQTGQSALQLSVKHGRVVMVRLLLSCGADANVQDSQGVTALMSACEKGHTHIARLLLERCHCNLNLTDKRGRTALSAALQGSHADTAALLQAHAKARRV